VSRLFSPSEQHTAHVEQRRGKSQALGLRLVVTLILVTPIAAHAQTSVPLASKDLRGQFYVGVPDIDVSGTESSSLGVGLQIEGPLKEKTLLRVGVIHGPTDLLSVLALSARTGTTLRAEIRSPAWQITLGDFLSPDHALSGSALRSNGVAIRRAGGLTFDVQAGRPKYLGAPAEGHMGQMSVDLALPIGTIGLLARDQARPLPRYSGIRIVSTSNVGSEQSFDDLQRLGQLLARETRLRSIGVQSQLRLGSHQSLLLRGGSMRLESVAGERSSGTSAEARYIVSLPRVKITAYARTSPPSVPGAYLPGDLMTANSRISVSRNLTAVSDGYSNLSSLIGKLPRVRSVGGSTGLQYVRDRFRVMAKANYRELNAASQRRITQSLTTNAAIKTGWLAVEGEFETTGPGHRDAGSLQAYRGRLRLFEDRDANMWWGVSYNDIGLSPRRVRVDFGGSLTRNDFMLDIGAGYGKGQLFGDDLNVWTTAEIPIVSGLMLLTSIDYVRWDYRHSPYVTFLRDYDFGSPWRFTIGFRQRFSIRSPLLRRQERERDPVSAAPSPPTID
jgi:hypothetical protein